MWTLILTLFVTGAARPAVAISSTSGFWTEASCKEAGKAWVEQVTKSVNAEMAKALCVKAGTS